MLLLGVATAMWPRGTSLAWKDRLKTAKLRLRSTPLRVVLAGNLVNWAVCATGSNTPN